MVGSQVLRPFLTDFPLGERGGLVVEPRTQEREVGVRYLLPPCCVLEQRYIYSPKSTGNTQEAVAPSRHDLKLFTGTLSLNKPKRTERTTSEPKGEVARVKLV